MNGLRSYKLQVQFFQGNVLSFFQLLFGTVNQITGSIDYMGFYLDPKILIAAASENEPCKAQILIKKKVVRITNSPSLSDDIVVFFLGEYIYLHWNCTCLIFLGLKSTKTMTLGVEYG